MKKKSIVAAALVLALCATASAQIDQPKGPQQQPAGSPVVSVPATIPQANPDQPTQNAVAVKEVESPAAPSHATDQAIWALMVSLLMQYLKKAPWFTLLSDRTSSRAKSLVGFCAALLTAAGIHFAVSGSIFDGGGASITVTGLSMNAFKDLAWQWAAQQGWYRAVVKEPKEFAFVPAPPSNT
jgi:hypothetical protein